MLVLAWAADRLEYPQGSIICVKVVDVTCHAFLNLVDAMEL